MTTTTEQAPARTLATPTPASTVRRVGLRQALTAEWIKLRSVRSTAWTLASLVVLGAGLR